MIVSPRHIDRETLTPADRYISCQRKKRFKTEENARAARKRVMKQWRTGQVVIYRCHNCGGWHLSTP
jgi:hypothetical protein